MANDLVHPVVIPEDATVYLRILAAFCGDIYPVAELDLAPLPESSSLCKSFPAILL